MSLSTLICTYNRPKFLSQSLHALIDRTNEKPDQVVVVNGGDERSDDIVKSFIESCGIEVKLIKTANKNLATSRNVGLHHCTGNIIAMTDDDAEVFPNWITEMKRAHQAYPEAGAVGGLVLGTNKGALVGKVADQITFPSWPEPRYVRTLPGVNISYKREVIEKVGLQDETLFRGEDVDFNWRILQLGYKIRFDPAIKVYHHHRPTFRSFINQHYMYGRAYYLVRKKWPNMYSIYPHGIKRPKDILKGINFFAGAVYQPFINSSALPNLLEKATALPLLFIIGLSWRWGMFEQFFKEKISDRS
jgi:GT2 family glycosyltransferase